MRPFKILVTGASSFLGAHLITELRARFQIVALNHHTPLSVRGVKVMKIDLTREDHRKRLQRIDADAVIHLAAVIKGKGSNPSEDALRINTEMMSAVLSLGIPVLYASSTVVHWDSDLPYVRSRLADEAALAACPLPYVVLRPSAPYGPRLIGHSPGHQESFHTLIRWIRRGIVPMIGDGSYRRQPIHVADFANAVALLLERDPATWSGQIFDIGGPRPLQFREIIERIAQIEQQKARFLRLPKGLMMKVATFLPDFDAGLLGAVDNDEVADPSKLIEETGLQLRTFDQGIRGVLRSL